jgi:flagellar basal-body rod protein FlgG
MQEAVRGCLKEEIRLDLISSNLANSTSVGFKKDRISFQNVLTQFTSQSGQIQPNEETASGSRFIRIETDFRQGDIRFTGNDLDFAISGKGFFKIDTPDGPRYTRKGNFAIDAEGYLVTQKGHRVMGKGGAINIWGDRVEVDKSGRIFVRASEFEQHSEVGQLDVVEIPNTTELVKDGGLFFRPSIEIDEIPIAPETVIRQGYVESSNVEVAKEMVNMVHCLRAFESYQKSIQILDRVDNKAINEVSRVR